MSGARRSKAAATAEPPPAALVEPRSSEPWQLLGPDGTLVDGPSPAIGEDVLRSCFEAMLLSREVDRQAFSLQRQGRLGTFSTVEGQEAAVIGAATALDPARDWVVPQYRELPAMLRQGYPLASFFLYFRGHPEGNRIPEGVNLLPFQISLAAQLPHAVGLGWGLRAQGSDGAVLAFFGDGASSEGDTHEAMNLAGVIRAPVVFLLQNNGWAISTPTAKQTAGSLVARAAGYGFPGLIVDGNDLIAVWEATRWALRRAREGAGPTLIEAVTYRLGPHNTADEPARYRSEDEVAAHRALDPLGRLRAFLLDRGLLGDGEEETLRQAAERRVAAAAAAAEELAAPPTEELFEHVYAAPTPRVRRQLERALAAEGGR